MAQSQLLRQCWEGLTQAAKLGFQKKGSLLRETLASEVGREYLFKETRQRTLKVTGAGQRGWGRGKRGLCPALPMQILAWNPHGLLPGSPSCPPS